MGDWVYVRERWREVTEVCTDQYVTGGLAVDFWFARGWPLRLPAGGVVRVIPRAAAWAWSLTDDPYAGPVVHHVACTTCRQVARPVDAVDGSEAWSLDHARRTGHTGFRTSVTGFVRAVRQQAECMGGS